MARISYWIGFTFGGQCWLKTLGTRQGEFEKSLASILPDSTF